MSVERICKLWTSSPAVMKLYRKCSERVGLLTNSVRCRQERLRGRGLRSRETNMCLEAISCQLVLCRQISKT